MTEEPTSTCTRRLEAISSLLDSLQGETPLTPDEAALVRWVGSFYEIDDLTPGTFASTLNKHREQRDKRARKKAAARARAADLEVEVLDAQGNPRSKKNRKLSPAQITRRNYRDDAIKAYTVLLLEGFDLTPLALELHGEDFVLAHADRLEAFAAEVAQQVANALSDRELSAYDKDLSRQLRKKKNVAPQPYEPPPRELHPPDLRKFTQRLTARLETFVETRRASYARQARVRALWAYYEGSFARLWEQEVEAWREQASMDGADLEPLFTYHSGEVLQYMRDYDGLWEVKEGRDALRHTLNVLDDAVARRLEEESQYQRLVSLYEAHSDFGSCFPVARSLTRRIEFFCGPTNSGKTHAAMNELAASASGVYLAPLRLLALEGQGNLASRGVASSFLTGEERDIDEDATFISSTIEMLDYETPIETAIIDEIQLLGEPQRGWAWTNALVGVPAERVILTGSPDALPLIQKIADYLGEEVIVNRFERFNKLEPLQTPASVAKGRLRHIEPGTAIICFSRRDVLEIKQHIEQITDMKVSVIYGGLAPEVRREEARRFRERESDVLVATDAISMGLNLPIRTVLFWQTYKYYNQQEHPLLDTDIKQIAGRAGRFGLEDCGFVGAFNEEDIKRVAEAMAVELGPLEPPCLVMPLPFHIELIAKALHTYDIVHIMRYFCERIWFSGDLFQPVVTEDMMMLARMLEEHIGEEPLPVQFTFVCAPVNMRANSVVQAHLDFAYYFGRGNNVPLPSLPVGKFRKGSASSSRELRDAEDAVHVATLYLWLSYRFPESFVDAEEAEETRVIINSYIARSLQHGGMARRCGRCDKPLPTGHKFGICEDCFGGQRRRQQRR